MKHDCVPAPLDKAFSRMLDLAGALSDPKWIEYVTDGFTIILALRQAEGEKAALKKTGEILSLLEDILLIERMNFMTNPPSPSMKGD